MKVLLVEDNVNDAMIIERTLKKSFDDVSVFRIDTEKDFRKELKKDYDIVLSDYSMPDFNGMTALKVRNKERPLIPFIIVTGSVNELTAVDCLMAGADNYILKEHLGRLAPAVKKAIKDKENEKLRIETEIKLKETGRLYDELVENSDLGIIIEDAKEKLIYANSKALDIVGYSYEALKRLRYYEMIHKDDLMRIKELREDRKSGRGKTNDFSVRIVTGNGTIKYVKIHIEKNYWKGRLNGERFYISDVTETYKSERLKDAANDVAMAALESGSIAGFSKSLHKILKKYITVNNFYVAVYEGSGARYRFPYIDDEQYHFDENQIVDIENSSIDLVRKKGKPVFITKQDIYDFIKKEKINYKYVVPEIWIGVPLIFERNIIGIVGMKEYYDKNALSRMDMEFLKDIAPYISIKIYQEGLLQKIKDNEIKFRDLYEHTPNAIIVHQNGRIVMANAAAVKLADVEKVDDLIGISIMDFVHPDYRQKVIERAERVLKSKEAQEPLVEGFITKTGKEIMVEAVSIPFEYEGKPAAQVIMNDVTEELKAKKLLEESEEKFRKAFKSSMDAISITKLQTGKFIEVNDSFVDITGYSYGEIIGKTSFELNIWLDVHDREYVVKEVINKGVINNFQTRFRMKSGAIEYALVSGRIISFDGIDYMMITSRLITDFIKVQKKIKESEEKFNQIFNSASDSIILYSLENDRMVFSECNSAFYNLYGYDSGEIIGKDAGITIDDIVLDDVDARVDRVLKGETIVFESVHKKKNGNRFPVEISAKSVKIGDKKFVLSIERDITARKEAEQAIRESEEKFRVGFRSAPDALAIINLKTGKAVELNEGFEKLTGYTLEELKSKDDVFVPFKSQDAIKQIKSIKDNKIDTTNINMDIVHKSGEIYHVLASASMIALNQTPHLLVVAKNITELKKTQDELIKAKEKAEESDRLKSAFLSNMSHEIRTPMNHIIGFTEFIKQGVSEEELQRYIEIIQRSGHHLLDLINDIIDISKIESGQFKLKTYIINPTLIMKELYEGFMFDKRIMENKEVELINDVQFTPGVKIRADKLRFRQILYNLIGNSIKFTRKGYIRYGFEDRNDGFLTFYVKDTGLGIAEKDIDLIFERFMQAGDVKLQNEGTGLGLALTKAFVEMMGGKIRVESVHGKGSTFYFTIPTVKSEDHDDSEKGGVRVDSRILLVNKDETDVFLFTTFLKNFIRRDNIVNVLDALSAIDRLDCEPFDVVVVNIEDSGQRSLEAIRIIKKNNKDVPVLAITAYKRQVDDLKLFENGIDGVIEKPLSTENIIKPLGKFIKIQH